MFENVRRDLTRACRANQSEEGLAPLLRELFNPGTQAILVHRFGYWCDQLPIPGVRHALRVLHFIIQYFFSWRVGVFIPIKAKIGPGLVIHTWGGGVFLPCTTIGRDVTIVGGGVLMDYLTRGIGDEVQIGAGTKIINKAKIGNRVRTGPNSVVQADVPDDCVVFGNPGRVIGPIPRMNAARPAPNAASSGNSSADPAPVLAESLT